MDPNNFVSGAPGGGWIVYVGGQNRGTYPTQREAEDAYNRAQGGGGGGGWPQRGGGEEWAMIAAMIGNWAAQMEEMRRQRELQERQWLSELGRSPVNYLKYWDYLRQIGPERAESLTGAAAAPGTAVNVPETGQWGSATPAGNLTNVQVPQEAPSWLQELGGFQGVPDLRLSQRQYRQLGPSAQQGLQGTVEHLGAYYPDWLQKIAAGWARWSQGAPTTFRR